MDNKQRLFKSVDSYIKAVEKVGFVKVEKEVGCIAASKLELARDAFHRQQSDYIVAGFLANAQEAFDKMYGSWDDTDMPSIYDHMNSL